MKLSNIPITTPDIQLKEPNIDQSIVKLKRRLKQMELRAQNGGHGWHPRRHLRGASAQSSSPHGPKRRPICAPPVSRGSSISVVCVALLLPCGIFLVVCSCRQAKAGPPIPGLLISVPRAD
ncbi:hypothetical protein KM043_001133 [Ampulex compressa]|nr:hypothetical protein KM043_001133 [Ampulex compressa]